MNLSNFYARVLGLYLVIMSVGMYFKPQPMLDLVFSSSGSASMPGLGIVALVLGLIIVVSHQVWKGWPIMITLIGYWAVIKGILIVFYTQETLKMFHNVLQGMNLQIGLGVDLALGLLLLFCGYKLAK
jgi:hypothetical protein